MQKKKFIPLMIAGTLLLTINATSAIVMGDFIFSTIGFATGILALVKGGIDWKKERRMELKHRQTIQYFKELSEKKEKAMQSLKEYNHSKASQKDHEQLQSKLKSARKTYEELLQVLTKGQEYEEYVLTSQQKIDVLKLMEQNQFDTQIPYSKHFIALMSSIAQKKLNSKKSMPAYEKLSLHKNALLHSETTTDEELQLM